MINMAARITMPPTAAPTAIGIVEADHTLMRADVVGIIDLTYKMMSL